MAWLSMGIAPALDREEFAEVLKSDDAEGLEEFHSLPFEQQYLLIRQVRIDERRSETKPATERAIALLQDLSGAEVFFREIVEAQPTWEGWQSNNSHFAMLAKIRRRWALDLAGEMLLDDREPISIQGLNPRDPRDYRTLTHSFGGNAPKNSSQGAGVMWRLDPEGLPDLSDVLVAPDRLKILRDWWEEVKDSPPGTFFPEEGVGSAAEGEAEAGPPPPPDPLAPPDAEPAAAGSEEAPDRAKNRTWLWVALLGALVLVAVLAALRGGRGRAS